METSTDEACRSFWREDDQVFGREEPNAWKAQFLYGRLHAAPFFGSNATTFVSSGGRIFQNFSASRFVTAL
jgi:hypothetical protein